MVPAKLLLSAHSFRLETALVASMLKVVLAEPVSVFWKSTGTAPLTTMASVVLSLSAIAPLRLPLPSRGSPSWNVPARIFVCPPRIGHRLGEDQRSVAILLQARQPP